MRRKVEVDAMRKFPNKRWGAALVAGLAGVALAVGGVTAAQAAPSKVQAEPSKAPSSTTKAKAASQKPAKPPAKKTASTPAKTTPAKKPATSTTTSTSGSSGSSGSSSAGTAAKPKTTKPVDKCATCGPVVLTRIVLYGTNVRQVQAATFLSSGIGVPYGAERQDPAGLKSGVGFTVLYNQFLSSWFALSGKGVPGAEVVVTVSYHADSTKYWTGCRAIVADDGTWACAVHGGGFTNNQYKTYTAVAVQSPNECGPASSWSTIWSARGSNGRL